MRRVGSTGNPAQPGQVSLCVGVQRVQSSIERGHSAQWIVSAWTQGGNVPDATIRLVASPASVTPKFSFGCGSHDGTASCDLGAVDANSSQRQLQARVAVAATASSVTSVQLTAEASAAHLPKDPVASATVTVTAPATGTGTSGTTGASGTPGSYGTGTTPLSVGNLPYVQASPILSPGGNAAGLFPALSPSSDPPSGKAGQQKAGVRTVANTAALPLGGPVVNAQLIGLAVLALAFVLAVTRLSIRRRPALGPAAGSAAAAGPGPKPVQAGEPAQAAQAADESKPEDHGKPEAGGEDILEA